MLRPACISAGEFVRFGFVQIETTDAEVEAVYTHS